MREGANSFGFQETGFGAFEAVPNPPSGHTHDTFEICVFEGGRVRMLYGGREVAVEPDRLVVHWGMLPHQLLVREPGAMVVGLHLPLAWVLQWSLPGNLLSRLLDLEVLIEPPRCEPCRDLALVRDWRRLLIENGESAADIVLAEVRARLLRMGVSAGRPGAAGPPAPPTSFARALRYIIAHIREPIRIADVARAAGISPRHLTRTFAGCTGQTINGYVSHLRLSYARRLLVSTDMKILDIMHASGFSCPTQFYRLFHEQAACTPRQYRGCFPLKRGFFEEGAPSALPASC